MIRTALRRTALLLVLLGAAEPMAAQDQAPAAAAGEPVVAPDSPRAAFRAFREAAAAGQWDEAARFLTLGEADQERGPQLAQRLNVVIDSLFLLDPASISGEPAGRLDDELPPDVEQIARVDVSAAAEPIRMIRTPQTPGVPWTFGPATVARIDAWYAKERTGWVRDHLAGAHLSLLVREGPLQLPYWYWLAFLFLGVISWGIARGLKALLRPLLARLTARTSSGYDDLLVQRIGPPLTLAFGLLLFTVSSALLGLTRPAFLVLRVVLRSGLAFAVFWGLWRATPVLMGFTMTRPWVMTSASARSLLAVGSNIVRAAIVLIGTLAILAGLGYPVGTVLAGLGIGGLALAFGAQKTVENVFGSISLAVDQPFRVGDFVKVEDFVGTVEDIGLRSTRFRTLDRTLVSIPNGKLADQRLESFEVRDRMRLAMTVGVTYDTTRTQMQTVLAGLEQVLRTHPKIWPDAVVVKFAGFGASSLDIEIMAWFQVPTWGDFQRCREEVLLGFMEVVEAAGSSFAFPTRTVHVVQGD